MRTLTIILSLFALSSGAACAAGKPPSQIERAGARRSDRISRDEITVRSWSDAYEVIATLRPQWLTQRGRDSYSGQSVIQVVMNGSRLGGVAALRRIPAADLEHAQYYDATAASSRWGVGFGQGAIELSTTPPR